MMNLYCRKSSTTASLHLALSIAQIFLLPSIAILVVVVVDTIAAAVRLVRQTQCLRILERFKTLAVGCV